MIYVGLNFIETTIKIVQQEIVLYQTIYTPNKLWIKLFFNFSVLNSFHS